MSWQSKAQKDSSFSSCVRTYWRLPLVVQSILIVFVVLANL